MHEDPPDDARAVEIVWEPTRRDLRQAVVLVMGSAKYYAFASVFVVLGVVATLLGMEPTQTGMSIPLLWLPWGLAVAMVFALTPRLAGNRVWRSPLARLPQRVRLDTTGMSAATDLVSIHMAWAALGTAFERDRFFIVATKSGSGAGFFVVPTDRLSDDEYTAARRLILENVGSFG